MFKQVQSGFTKFFTKERVFILFVFILLSWVLVSYSSSKSSFNKEGYDGMSVSDYLTGGSTKSPQPMQQQPIKSSPSTSLLPSIQPSVQAAQPSSILPSSVVSSASPFTQQTANPSDLLPKDENSQWAALNPNAMNKGDVLMPDLLQAGYHIGLDTIGQTLRNPNLQLRSDPIIPKQDIGPWNLSTIEPDIGRVPLEISDGR